MTAAITEALDILDWLEPAEIDALRGHVRRLTRLARERQAAGVVTHPMSVDPSFAAMVWVLWTTSDEYLAMHFEK